MKFCLIGLLFFVNHSFALEPICKDWLLLSSYKTELASKKQARIKVEQNIIRNYHNQIKKHQVQIGKYENHIKTDQVQIQDLERKINHTQSEAKVLLSQKPQAHALLLAIILSKARAHAKGYTIRKSQIQRKMKKHQAHIQEEQKLIDTYQTQIGKYQNLAKKYQTWAQEYQAKSKTYETLAKKDPHCNDLNYLKMAHNFNNKFAIYDKNSKENREGIKKNRNLVNHYKNLNNINRVTTYENFVSQARSSYKKDHALAANYKSQADLFIKKAKNRNSINL